MQEAIAAVPRIRIARARDEEGRVARAILFKVDHPRAIDRYIDYFGGPRPSGASVSPLFPAAELAAGGGIPIEELRYRRRRLQDRLNIHPIT